MSKMSDETSLYWGREGTFIDVEADIRAEGVGVYRVPEEWRGYLLSRGWSEVPSDYDGDVGETGSALSLESEGKGREAYRGASTPEDVDAEGDGDGDGGGGGDGGSGK